MVKISLNFNKNLFHALINNTINKKRTPQKKPKAVKDRGGVEGRYDRGQRFNGFFKASHCLLQQISHGFLTEPVGQIDRLTDRLIDRLTAEQCCRIS